MFWQNNLRWGALAFSVLLLAACVSNDTKSESGKDNEVVSTTASKVTNDTRNVQAPLTYKSPVVIANPSIITFDKMSITLDDKAKETVAQLVERAKSANKLVVTGFCDRRQIGNSENSAIARAVVVRDELLAQGIPPANIQVKFSTKVPKKHAAEIHFD